MTTDRRSPVRRPLLAALLATAAILVAATPAHADLNYLPHHIAVETNERYGHD